MGITATTPQLLQVLDSSRTWATVGSVDPATHSAGAFPLGYFNVLAYGFTPTSPDGTAALNAAMTANNAGFGVTVPWATTPTDKVTLSASLTGFHAVRSTLQRLSTTTTGSWLNITGSRLGFADIIVDGNLANATGDNNFNLAGYRALRMFNVESRHAVTNAGWGGGFSFASSNDGATASFTGAISGTTLTVTAPTGTIIPPFWIDPTPGGIAAGTQVVSQLTGTTGGAGTYQVFPTQTVASAAMSGANTSHSYLVNTDARDNMGGGVQLTSGNNLSWMDSQFVGNGATGFRVSNGTIPPGITVKRLSLIGDTFAYNGSNGYNCQSYSKSNGSIGVVYGVNPVAEGVIVGFNQAHNNGSYGLYSSCIHALTIGNNIFDNGETSGAIGENDLFLGQGLHALNLIHGGRGLIQLEAGGAENAVLALDYIYKPHDPDMAGLNLGGSIGTTAFGEFLSGNGATSHPNIQIFDPESASTGLPQLTTGLFITQSVIRLQTAGEMGIYALGDPQSTVKDNWCFVGTSGTANLCYVLRGAQIANDNNHIVNADGSELQAITAAATTTIPDGGTQFSLTGSVTITQLQSYSSSNAAWTVRLTTPYTGITNASLVIGATTGGSYSVRPTFNAASFVDGNGALHGMSVTSPGTGTGPPTGCSVSGGGATGGSCLIVLLTPNRERHIELRVGAGVVLSPSGNMRLANSLAFVGQNDSGGNPLAMIRFVGDGAGNWIEINRSIVPGAIFSIGNYAPVSVNGATHNVQVLGTTTASRNFDVAGFNSTGSLAAMNCAISRSSAPGAAPVAVALNDECDFNVIGDDGTGLGSGGRLAKIAFQVAGTVAGNQVPGIITFNVANSAGALTKVLSLTGAGQLQMGTAGFTANGAVAISPPGSLGPTGASGTVRKWLTVQDTGGVVYYLPAY